MPQDKVNQIGNKIDRIGQKYRFWIVIPLILTAFIAPWNFPVAIGFLAFLIFVWGFGGAVEIILWAVTKVLPKNISPEAKIKIQEAIKGTLFLGGLGIIGMVLRDDNVISNSISEKTPDGMSLNFIDPTFAMVCIIGIWVYTAYKICK